MDDTSEMGVTWNLVVSACTCLSAGEVEQPSVYHYLLALLLVHIFC